jgi:hypothetical protein
MKRNILLLSACLCLAGFLIIHRRHQPAASMPVATPAAAPVQPANPAPALHAVTPAPTAATETAPAPRRRGPKGKTIGGFAAIMTDANDENAEEKDKFELLRDLTAWAARDFDAALAATMKLPDGEERNEALCAVCNGLAQTDPADAVKMAQEFRLDQQGTAILQDLVQQWAGTDLVASLAWVGGQPAGAARDEMTTRVAFIMAQGDPADAAALVMNQIAPGAARDEAIMTVLHQWGQQDMPAAARWANQSAPPGLQERIINELNSILDSSQPAAQGS